MNESRKSYGTTLPQREEAAKRNSEGVEWRPQLFTPIKTGLNGAGPGEEDLEWIINAKV
jgi:hypothetical protein